MILSIVLISGISRKSYKLLVPWICFQLFTIFYQVYFFSEVLKSDNFKTAEFSSIVILMVLISHIIFESYYSCVIIGLSQIIANIEVITSFDDHNYKMEDIRVLNCL